MKREKGVQECFADLLPARGAMGAGLSPLCYRFGLASGGGVAVKSAAMSSPLIPDLPYTVAVPTIYGPMLLNRHDINQTNSLFKTGHAIDHNEIALLARFLQSSNGDHIVLDIGANFGTYSMALARFVGPNGRVHAFEAQRIIYYMLAGSVALNSFSHVFCHHLAIGDRQGRIEIPQFNYSQPMNFGSVEFGPEQKEIVHQARGNDPARTEYVELTTIDHLNFPKVTLMKIDTEGMEPQVLQGARQTIQRCRPVLYVEHAKNDKSALASHIESLDYVVHENGINFLCIPREMEGKVAIGRQ